MIETDRPVALVTGANGGIGVAIVERLLHDGFNVLAAIRDSSDVSDLVERWPDPDRVVVHAADLIVRSAAEELVNECVERFGGLDVLVNNAAVTGEAALMPLLECDDDRFDEIIDVNLGAAFRCARAAAPHLGRSAIAVIVNIGSVAAFAAQIHATAYTASKAGLLGLTRGLALELAPHGVRAVFLAPGDIALSDVGEAHTGSNSGSNEPAIPAPRSTPLGRRGTPGDVAGVVSFICSKDADFITGTSITIDGGWTTY